MEHTLVMWRVLYKIWLKFNILFGKGYKKRNKQEVSIYWKNEAYIHTCSVGLNKALLIFLSLIPIFLVDKQVQHVFPEHILFDEKIESPNSWQNPNQDFTLCGPMHSSKFEFHKLIFWFRGLWVICAVLYKNENKF